MLFNFLYRKPKPFSHLLKPGHHPAHMGYWFRLALHYILTQEPTIQSCFRREFWWARHWLHPDDIPSDCLVVLSGRDSIVPSQRVYEYLCTHATATARDDEIDDVPFPAKGGRRTSLHGRARRLFVELRERWHHGWLMAHPFAQRRLIAQLLELVEREAQPLREDHPYPIK